MISLRSFLKSIPFLAALPGVGKMFAAESVDFGLPKDVLTRMVDGVEVSLSFKMSPNRERAEYRWTGGGKLYSPYFDNPKEALEFANAGKLSCDPERCGCCGLNIDEIWKKILGEQPANLTDEGRMG